MRTLPTVVRAALPALMLLAAPALGQAQLAQSLAPEDPDFDRILADPDNPELNLKFAQSEAAGGRLLSAAAALERILIVHPEWNSIRLFYGSVLYRLDDRQSARREFLLLKTKDISADQKAEVERYLRLLERRANAVRINGLLSVGVAYDSNAQGALSSSVDVGLGIYRPDDGLSAVTQLSLDLAKPFGPGGNGAFASVSVLSKNDVSGPNQSYQRGDLSLGLYGSSPRGSWRAGGLVRTVRLFNDRYLTEYGGRADLTRRTSAKTSIGASIEVVHQDYVPASLEVLMNEIRSGRRIDAGLQLTHRFNVNHTLFTQVGFEDKQASYKPFGYRGPYVLAAYTAQLGRGSYFNLAATARLLDYKAIDLINSGTKRHDVRTFARAALGAPISAFTTKGVTGDYRERLRLEGAVSYSRQDTRAPFVDFDSFGAELRLLWRFGG